VPAWSQAANWAGSAPAGSVDALEFPALTDAACTANPPAGTCYQSFNDEPGVASGALSIDDGAGYDIGGNAVTLGAGGLTAAPSAGDPASVDELYSSLGLPIVLSAPQTWTVTGGSANQQLLVTGALTGPAVDPLTVALPDDNAGLTVTDAELGPVMVVGGGATSGGFVKIGYFDDAGTLVPGSLNATDSNLVKVTQGAGLLSLDGTIGPLDSIDGLVQVGQADQAGKLGVNGDLAFDDESGLLTFLGDGAAGGTDYSQVTASGTVDLGDATLGLVDAENPGGNACEQLTPGDVDTLISATAGLTGQFNNVSGGATVPLACPGSGGTPPTVKILYTANAVTATIVTSGTPGAPTTTALAADQAAPVTNQPITLTATVTSAGAADPLGTVEFVDDAGGHSVPIPACIAQGLGGTGSTRTATCTASFAATDAPQVSAVYLPADGSPLAGSQASDLALNVAPAATATSLTVSALTTVGNEPAVTATATVTPAQPGATQPTGTIDFEANGAQIPNAPGSAGCQAVGLSGGSLVDECEIINPGGRTITATYSGDANFLGSVSAPVASPGSSGAAPVTPPAAAAAAKPKAAPVTGIGRAGIGRASSTAATANVIVTCKGGAGQHCTVTLKLAVVERTRAGKLASAKASAAKAPVRSRTVVVGTRTVTIRAGLGEIVHISLNAAGRTALKRLHKLPVTLTGTEKTSTGTAPPTVRSFAFKTALSGGA
jgi:hypothetical protein